MSLAGVTQQACGRTRFQKGWMALACGHRGEVGVSRSSEPGSQEHTCPPAWEVLEQSVFCPTWGSS